MPAEYRVCIPFANRIEKGNSDNNKTDNSEILLSIGWFVGFSYCRENVYACILVAKNYKCWRLLSQLIASISHDFPQQWRSQQQVLAIVVIWCQLLFFFFCCFICLSTASLCPFFATMSFQLYIQNCLFYDDDDKNCNTTVTGFCLHSNSIDIFIFIMKFLLLLLLFCFMYLGCLVSWSYILFCEQASSDTTNLTNDNKW